MKYMFVKCSNADKILSLLITALLRRFFRDLGAVICMTLLTYSLTSLKLGTVLLSSLQLIRFTVVFRATVASDGEDSVRDATMPSRGTGEK